MVAQHIELTPQAILDYVDRHFAEPISPRDVAAAMHYSLCHVTHVARRYLGAPVSELILQRRIEAARRLLEESTMPIALVAAQVGFGDVAYFSRRFSQAAGVAPSQWRKLHRHSPHGSRCHACGTALVALAQDDAPQVSVSPA
jgi:AraC-like DNA-binding protein